MCSREFGTQTSLRLARLSPHVEQNFALTRRGSLRYTALVVTLDERDICVIVPIFEQGRVCVSGFDITRRRQNNVPCLSGFGRRSHEGASPPPPPLRCVEPSRSQEEPYVRAEFAASDDCDAGRQSALESDDQRDDQPRFSRLSFGREAAPEGIDEEIASSPQKEEVKPSPFDTN
jgi:hypothetical protein